MTSETQQRHISKLTKDTVALILAGGRGSRLYELTEWRAKPAVFFGGKFRIIDFPLSNCINSGIRRIGVLTQYKAHSLIRHLHRGWGGFRHELDEYVEVLPASQRTGENWYAGTADAIYQNIDILRNQGSKYVLVLSGDHIYKMDYGLMIAEHQRTGADMTVACIEVPVAEATGFGVMNVDESNRVIGFDEKPANPQHVPGNPKAALASMGNYIFNTDFLYQLLCDDADNPNSSHDFGHDIIPKLIQQNKVQAYRFRDIVTGGDAYWQDVGTLDAFWRANLEMADVVPKLDLYDDSWPLLTYQAQLPPAKFVFEEEGRTGAAYDSLVSGGCVVSGSTVRGSVLFSHVYVHTGALVEKSVILPDVDIGRGCTIRNAIIDRGCKIAAGTEIGVDKEADIAAGYRVTDGGVTLVTAEMLGQYIHLHREKDKS